MPSWMSLFVTLPNYWDFINYIFFKSPLLNLLNDNNKTVFDEDSVN